MDARWTAEYIEYFGTTFQYLYFNFMEIRVTLLLVNVFNVSRLLAVDIAS